MTGYVFKRTRSIVLSNQGRLLCKRCARPIGELEDTLLYLGDRHGGKHKAQLTIVALGSLIALPRG